MSALLLRCLLLVVVLVPLLMITKSQGQKDARSSAAAAFKALPVYLAGFAAVTLVMLLLERLFIG
jgi:uncharacterized membrane protein YadS